MSGDLTILPDPQRVICRRIEREWNLDACYIKRTGEFRINLRTSEGGTEATAYYTDDPQDALDTAKAMREFEQRKQGQSVTVTYTPGAGLPSTTWTVTCDPTNPAMPWIAGPPARPNEFRAESLTRVMLLIADAIGR